MRKERCGALAASTLWASSTVVAMVFSEFSVGTLIFMIATYFSATLFLVRMIRSHCVLNAASKALLLIPLFFYLAGIDGWVQMPIQQTMHSFGPEKKLTILLTTSTFSMLVACIVMGHFFIMIYQNHAATVAVTTSIIIECLGVFSTRMQSDMIRGLYLLIIPGMLGAAVGILLLRLAILRWMPQLIHQRAYRP